MILQALTRHYEDLLEMGKVPRPGWGIAKVSYGLELSADGEVLALLSLQRTVPKGKQNSLVPQEREVPMPVKRSSGVFPNFLCDNSGYLLGADEKGKPKRTQQCFAASKKLHLDLLGTAESPAARAVAAFFEKWDPAKAAEHPALAERWTELMKGVNLIFWYGDSPVFEDPEVRSLWQAHYDQAGEGEQVRCLVTGKPAVPEEIHPSIKGVQGAQSSGAALVSFNAPAFCSYGHDYAPIGNYAAFAYTTALNHLLADWDHVRRVADTSVVCWAEGGQSAYQDAGLFAMYGDTVTDSDLWSALDQLAQGRPVDWEGQELDPTTRFYVLGLAPNAARLSIRFFWQNHFGTMAQNVMKHYRALEIERPAYDDREFLPLWSLLRETVNKNIRNATPSEQMAGDTLRAVLTGEPYPSTLLHGVMLRIRAEREITRGRAAIIKAYYLRNPNPKMPKEVLEVKLNEESDYIPYVLGRLFSVLEAIQESANPNVNATIKDRYFNSASATPAVVFPILINLAQKHLHKLARGQQIYYDTQLSQLLEKIKETYPTRMTFVEQGAFQLGYYHQTQKRYTKKEEQ
jgi:CRISPR-associated protein Csd1